MGHVGSTAVTIHPTRKVAGRLRVPGDKSISHRYGMLAALARGRTTIERYAPGADCAATLACLAQLGVDIRRSVTATPGALPSDQRVEIEGRGLRGLCRPTSILDARNSGSTMRMLAGVLAAHPFQSVIDGDQSLRTRPMRGVIEPLTQMGASVTGDHDRPPLRIVGADLHGIDYRPAVPSAQVKSAVLLAGLQAAGSTTVRETAQTRDHTERALGFLGATVERHDDGLTLPGGQQLAGRWLAVPGDLSSAAFWAAAAAALPGSWIEIAEVGLNPTRTAFLDVLQRLGAEVEAIVEREEANEPVGTLRVRHVELMPLAIAPAEVPGLIDELPVLAALATFGGGLDVRGARELRTKESDRIAMLAAGLNRLGADVEERADGFSVRPARRLRGGTADAAGDHRLAMAFAIAALGASDPSVIIGAEAVAVSYPGFFEVLQSICR